jgi:hypothetical protein
VQEIPSGQPRPITPEGTHLGALSPDGRLVLAKSSNGSWVLYGVDGGPPRAVPGLTARDFVARWSTDGRSVLVYDARQVPSRVEWFALDSGRRDLLMLLGTENQVGVLAFSGFSVAGDPDTYAYSCYRMLSCLFVVDGAR